MTFPSEVLAYLLFFRLAVVAVGFFSLFFGYRLFAKSTPVAGANSEIESALPGMKIVVRNAAPGTAFALFGALLIVSMVIQNSPSVTMSWVKGMDGVQSSNSQTVGETLQMRGDGHESIDSITETGRELDRNNDARHAQEKYLEAVTEIAEPINDLAWSYFQTGRSKDALGLATIAVQLRPDEPRYLDTLKRTRESLGISNSGSEGPHK